MAASVDTTARPRRRRLEAIESMRGLAAAGILVLHVWIVSGRQDTVVPPNALGILRFGLPMFFVLSAFFNARGWIAAALGDGRPPASGRFLLKRAARILPLYWLTGLVALWILSGTGTRSEPDGHQLIAYALMLQDWWPPDSDGVLNPPAWTLPIEFGFYLALPLIGAALVAVARGSRARLLTGIAVLFLAGLAYCVAFDVVDPELGWSRTPLLMAPCFAAGMFVAAALHDRTLPVATGLALFWAGVVAFGLFAFGPFGWLTPKLPYRDAAASVCFALMIAGAAIHGPRPMTVRPLVWLGTLSYGIYLWHFPMIFVLRTHDGWWPPDDVGLALLRVVAMTLVAAFLSYRLVEQPFGRWSARQLSGSPSSASRTRRERPRAGSPDPDAS